MSTVPEIQRQMQDLHDVIDSLESFAHGLHGETYQADPAPTLPDNVAGLLQELPVTLQAMTSRVNAIINQMGESLYGNEENEKIQCAADIPGTGSSNAKTSSSRPFCR